MKTKNIIISFIAIIIFGNMYGQKGDIVLSFSGKNIETNATVLLESVFIDNLTVGCDTTIYGESPFLYLSWPSLIGDNIIGNNEPFSLKPNYPNPFSDITHFEIDIKGKQSLKIVLVDINGSIISEINKELNHGLHTFKIDVNNGKMYLLSVSNGELTKTIKLIKNGNNIKTHEGIEYIGFENAHGYKTIEKISSFAFSPGDQLLMKATAVGYYDNTLFDNPNENTNYLFELQQEAIISMPSVLTLNVNEITQNSATSGGNVTDDGGADVTERGVCWSTLQNPTLANDFTVDGSGTGTYTSYLTGLSLNTTYYVRAYATNSVGTSYGNDLLFTSGQTNTTPVVTTQAITNISQNSATSGGNVTYDGGANVTERGVCWSTSQNPTLSDNFTVNGSGTGAFTSYLTGLSGNTTYYVRAYATNSVGTSYGIELSFITDQTSTIPSVTTIVITEVTQNSATSGGNVTDEGGAYVTSKGVCWSISQNPTLANDYTVDGSGIGLYTSYLTDLSSNTNYYIRAYATNSVGTSYGNELLFITGQTNTIPVVTTNPVTDITQISATSGGNVTDDGGADVTERGVCWSTSQNPTLSDNFTVDGSGTGMFVSYLTGLSANTTYYIRAYATNSEGTSYGNELLFTSGQTNTTPVVTTQPITNISQNSATSGGNVTNDGGADVTERGVCWSTSQNPTLSDDFTVDGSGTGTFTSYLTGLSANTTYYVRAYATNSVGTSYGNEISFTTLTFPTVTTNPVTDIAENSATSGGNVTNDGGADVTERGVCWSTSQNPTLANDFTVDGSGTGTYASYLTGLSSNTTYYVRAYATNSVGTSYGNELSFTTHTFPTVTTNPVTDIAENSATSGGNVTNDGGANVTERGVCWSTSQNPTLANDFTVDGSGTGTYTSYLTGLSSNVTYYVRAYATNSVGTSYGNALSFVTLVPFPCGTQISYGGQLYNTVQIGNQCWFAENLNIGTRIDETIFQSDNGIIEKYCYNDIEDSCDVYGGLYEWDEMMQYTTTEGAQGICPNGWHIATDDDWKILEGTVDTQYPVGDPEWDNYGWRGFDAGKNLKSTSGWGYGGNGTNSSGFSALPGGSQNYTTGYNSLGDSGHWWTSSEMYPSSAYGITRFLADVFDKIANQNDNKWYSRSVRCIKD